MKKLIGTLAVAIVLASCGMSSSQKLLNRWADTEHYFDNHGTAAAVSTLDARIKSEALRFVHEAIEDAVTKCMGYQFLGKSTFKVALEGEVATILSGNYQAPSLENYIYSLYDANSQAAVELLQAEKIAVLIISGENQYADYNEVDSMAADILRAVPDAVLSLDYAGTDTYASLQNAGDIFGYRADYTLISQHFHNQRALFYACIMMSGNVYAYDATDTHSIGWRARNTVREIFARTKAVLLVSVVLLKS